VALHASTAHPKCAVPLPSWPWRVSRQGKKDGKLQQIAARGGEHKERITTMAEETYTFRCTVCGWEVTVDTPELPDDFVCEVCGVGPDMFELVEE